VTLDSVVDVLANLQTYFPTHNPADGFEIAGFGWHQGWNDRVTPAFAAEYEVNMARFIRDVRSAVGVPAMPFVIGTTGMDGTPDYSEVELAQLQMENFTAYPDFNGNVAAVDTQSFWFPVNQSPADEGYHWNRNAASYYQVGNAMGLEMKSIIVAASNTAPVATAQSVSTAEDTAKVITLAGTDAENNALTYSIVTPPASGTLSGTAPNMTYTPALNYNGAVSFTFKVNDGTVDSSPATVSITVTAVNDAPVATAQSVSTAEDTAKAITLTGSDLENSTLTYTIVAAPTNGSLNGTAPDLTYTPAENYNGPDSFTFKVNDGSNDSAPATVSITVNPAYTVWSAGPFPSGQTLTDPDAGRDFDGGSLPTGIEWVVGGDPTNGGDDAALAPSIRPAVEPGFHVVTYRLSNQAAADSRTDAFIDYSTGLGTWTKAIHNGDTIHITTTPGPTFATVEVKLKNTLAPDGRLFVRLKATVTP
jgi:VCBS repeat-containing protein